MLWRSRGKITSLTSTPASLSRHKIHRPGPGEHPRLTRHVIKELVSCSSDLAEGLRMVVDVLLKITGALHKAGVPIVAGTDVGVPSHTLHRELELYVKAGLTPLEAIQTATIVPARVIKLDGEVGAIEVGKRADLVVLDANPIDNINNIRKVRFVAAQGRLFDCARLWQSVDFKSSD